MVVVMGAMLVIVLTVVLEVTLEGELVVVLVG